MSLTDSDLKLIEKVAEGELPTDLQEIFREKLKDKEFFDQYELHRATIDSIRRVHLRHDFKAYLQNKRASHYSPSEGPLITKNLYRGYYYLAASLAGILICSLVYMVVRERSSKELFKKYYSPFELHTSTRGNDPSASQALIHYENDEYVAAIPALELLKKSGQNADVVFTIELLLGNSYLKTGQDELAVKALQNASSSNDRMIASTAKWYLALAFLKLEKDSEAKQLLQGLIDSHSSFEKQSGALLRELH